MVANEALLHNWFYGNFFVREIAAIGFAFLMGSIPITPAFRWLFADLDPRLARTAAALAPGVNAVKAFVPVAIAYHGGGLAIGASAAVAVVAGHGFCPWLRFRGGTGVAVEFGALAALCWPAALIYFVLWLVGAVASNYATVGSLLASGFSFVSLWYFLGAPGAFAGIAMFAIVAARHRASLGRLSEARETPLRKGANAEAPAPPPLAQRDSIVVMDGQPVQSF
jgi:glycerol-3-phosphate acyltransferase PlsY